MTSSSGTDPPAAGLVARERLERHGADTLTDAELLTILAGLNGPRALARPDVQSKLTDLSWRTGAGHVTGVSLVYGEPEPQSDHGAGSRHRRGRRGRGGLAGQRRRHRPGPRGAHARGAAAHAPRLEEPRKYAPDVDDPRKTSMPADRAALRRPGRVSSRRSYLRPPLPVDTVAHIFEFRDAGLSFKKIGKALGIAAWTGLALRPQLRGGRPDDGCQATWRTDPPATV